MQKSSIWPPVFAATAASLIFVCSGFHYGWSEVHLPELIYGNFHMRITASQASWINLCLHVGSMCGSLLGLMLVDKLGRRTTLLSMTVPLVISCALIAGAQSYWYFYLARFIAGLGIGAAFMVTPMYIGEISEDRIRGGLCALPSVMVIIGQLIVHFIGPLVSVAALAIVGTIIPVVFFTALLWAPESPYFYAIKNAPNDTRKSLVWLKGTPDVVQDVNLIRNSIALNSRKVVNLFTVSSNRKALFITIGLLIGQQLFSNLTVCFSAAYIYDSNIQTNFDLLSNIVLAVQLVVPICIVFLTDKVGRRPLLLISASLCAVCLFVAGLSFHLRAAGMGNSGLLLEPGFALVGSLISYSIGLGVLPNVVAAEIFPCEVKALALAISTACYFAAGTVLPMLWGLVFTTHIRFHIIIYSLSACSIVSTIFIYFVVPETKGRSLNEIQTALRGHYQTRL